VPGYTSYHGRLFLRERGIKLRPAVVIVGFGFNDALDSGDIETVIERQRRALLIGRADEALLGHSVFYRWLRWVGAPPANTFGPRVDITKYRQNSEDMIRFAREEGVEVVLVDFLPPGTIHPEYKRAIAALAEEFAVPLIEYPCPTLDVVHPTVEGYGWLAQQLAQVMAERRYLD
jgi:lysophospholipase L1-like esterase